MATRVLIAILVIAGAIVLGQWWLPLVLAMWFADISRPLKLRLRGWLGGPRRAAAALTVIFFFALVLPLGLCVGLAVDGVHQLWLQLKAANGPGALVALVSGAPPETSLRDEVLTFLRSHGESALKSLSVVAGASVSVVLGVFLFLLALYTFSVHGKRVYGWLLESTPLERTSVRRLVTAFRETGRGLIVGVGLTAAIQGVVATTAYFALGVPRAFVLGFMTAIAALIPTPGTALVWAPVSAGLALTGHPVRALVLVAIGLGVIGVIDNILRPVLARFGKLQLPAFVLLLSMFGGIALFGTWGLLLGPLLVRLGEEGLAIEHDRRSNERRLRSNERRLLGGARSHRAPTR
ncbi:MAG: AI-2E family transporter [Polyangiaceae bacterium]